ncbi:MAG: HlyC/CorC family transporter [Alphaproteobacteria bacterium]
METELIATLVGILVLLILSGLFSGSETALTAFSRPRMHLLERQGDDRARLVNSLVKNKEKMIGAILLGNNLVNILASALATSLLISFFGKNGVVYATLAMTFLVLIFGEIAPKTYAFYHSDRVSLAVAPLFRVLIFILSPVTQAINWMISNAMRVIGINFVEFSDKAEAVEALRGAIELHQGDHSDIQHERVMLRSILDLSDVDVSEVMHHRQDLVMVDGDLPPAEIIKQIVNAPYTRIPVWRSEMDNIVGVLHVKELLRQVSANLDNPNRINIDNVSSPPWFIPESTSLLDQLQAFRRRREHFALVVDEYGSLMGVVTLEDILEEIVGDIADEHDVVPLGVRPQTDGSYIVDGRVTIRDLNRRFDWGLNDQTAATLAGLVIEIGKVIPEEGQIFNQEGFRFEIMSRRQNRLAMIRVTPPRVQKKE